MDLADTPRHRPMAFDKMEALIKEMQDPETGVPVRSQKLFLTYIPAAFMGYDLIEWLMERFNLDETSNVEAINLGNQLCQYGYFFPVNDSKNLILKDDSSLYRFQSPYYWPWQAPKVAGGSSAPSIGPDNVEYAIYLVKRTLRNKQRHGLEDYELEALANLKKNLAGKWDFITMQAEEQVRLAKDRKKNDKVVADSQERAYWRVARPPPGMSSALEHCPVPVRARHATHARRKTQQQLTREIEHLKASLDRTRVKTSIALEALLAYSETFAPYDPWLTPPLPSNPWVSDDTLFWQINSPLVDVPSEKRVQRWALSIEELVADPTGLQEFTSFLRKEYSHENIRFWLAVMDLRRSSTKQIPIKLQEIYQEFLKPGAPCEINIDGATADRVAEGLRSGSRYALDHAADHVYGLLLKKDCYPRFIRSDHFQRLLAEGRNVHQKKAKFFNFGGQVKKKPAGPAAVAAPGLGRRRGSERSLSGSAHELAVSAAQPPRAVPPPPHSHSQADLHQIPREGEDDAADVMPWEVGGREAGGGGRRRQDSAADSGSSSSDLSAAVVVPGVLGGAGGSAERRRLPQQSTLDGGLRGAPPPLRRLSAVEPRHLAPLASPPTSPRPAPAPAPTAAPPLRPTPTISVSSAPASPPASPATSPERSLAASDEPSSVFASAAATPTHPSDDCEHVTVTEVTVIVQPVLRAMSVDEPSAGAVPARAADGAAHGTLSRQSSTIKEISPASNTLTSSEIGDLPESSRETEDGASTSSAASAAMQRAPAGAGSALPAAPAPPVPAVPTPPVPAPPSTAPAPAPPPAPAPAVVVSTAETVANMAVSGPQPSEQPTAPPATAPAPAPARTPPVAPLAECEDIVEDDTLDKVPAPLQRVPSVAAADAVAHSDAPPTLSEPATRDNGPGQRNDICPWEDENSCESEAPFVKTYATLGYL